MRASLALSLMNLTQPPNASISLATVKTALVLLQQLFSLDNKAQAVIIMNSLAVRQTHTLSFTRLCLLNSL